MKLVLEIVLLASAGVVYSADDCKRDMEVVCYYGSWSIYRNDIGLFTTEDIDPSLCTNIIYTFAGLGLDSKIGSLDPWADVEKRGFANLTGFKEQYPCLRTTLAIGGWNEGSIKYSVMAYTEESRKAFADSVLRFLVYYGFDGLDLDWEYPTSRGGLPDDGKNFAALLKTVKETIAPWGLTLTTAVPIDVSLLNTAYDAKVMAEVVDYVHLMAYDYVPSTSNVTGLSAPLSAIKVTVGNWIAAGLPANKLVLGVPSYGRNYVLKDSEDHDVGDPVLKAGEPGLYTAEEGFLAYYEVMEILSDPFLGMRSVHVDDTNYAYGNEEWITYETETSVRTKAQYAVDQKLGGMMIWSIDTEDFLGLYGTKFPLLNAIHEVLKQNKLKV
ncbi:hypothetical protein NQ315_011522 [Exocentrus adspersus]|uniref:GH18 domain-containing protein n=1 Tax=Exocentrus adspersus TaxID=1586481 RepID=A0AAV8VVY2_9CUCU|nr:hypothetical protein NQ315_011522 [Exocentrus adspersus]